MLWNKKNTYLEQYEFTSSNQHGMRYKKIASKRVSVATLSADWTNADDMRRLILLSHHLDIPVRYDFNADPQQAYIEVVGKEALEIN